MSYNFVFVTTKCSERTLQGWGIFSRIKMLAPGLRVSGIQQMMEDNGDGSNPWVTDTHGRVPAPGLEAAHLLLSSAFRE